MSIWTKLKNLFRRMAEPPTQQEDTFGSIAVGTTFIHDNYEYIKVDDKTAKHVWQLYSDVKH